MSEPKHPNCSPDTKSGPEHREAGSHTKQVPGSSQSPPLGPVFHLAQLVKIPIFSFDLGALSGLQVPAVTCAAVLSSVSSFFKVRGGLATDLRETAQGLLTLLSQIAQREPSLAPLATQTERLQSELSALQTHIKDEKRKMVTLIMNKDRELEAARQSISEMKEALALRQEITDLKEENLRLKNTIERQGYLIDDLKRPNVSREDSSVCSRGFSQQPEVLDNLSRFSEISRKIETLLVERGDREREAEELQRKAKTVQQDLKTHEAKMNELTDAFKRDRQRGVLPASHESDWKKDFDAALAGIEVANKRVQTLKRTFAQLTQELEINEERVEQLNELVAHLSTERNRVRNNLPNQVISEGLAKMVGSTRKIRPPQTHVRPFGNTSAGPSPDKLRQPPFHIKQADSPHKVMKFSAREMPRESDLFENFEKQTICLNQRLRPAKPHKHIPAHIKIRAMVRKLAVFEAKYTNAVELAKVKVRKIEEHWKQFGEDLASRRAAKVPRPPPTKTRVADLLSARKAGSIQAPDVPGIASSTVTRDVFTPVEVIRLRNLLKNSALKDQVHASLLEKVRHPPTQQTPRSKPDKPWWLFASFAGANDGVDVDRGPGHLTARASPVPHKLTLDIVPSCLARTGKSTQATDNFRKLQTTRGRPPFNSFGKEEPPRPALQKNNYI